MPLFPRIGDSRVEEARIPAALAQIPEQVMAFDAYQQSLAVALASAANFDTALRVCTDHGYALWRAATEQVQRSASKDDRPLYWGRLQMLQRIRHHLFSFDFASEERNTLLAALEDASRGRNSANFTQAHSKRILVTGFDPFGFAKALDDNSPADLSASNPSGAAALELSNRVLLHQGRVAEVQAAIFPVRFEDFDVGVVERFFRGYFVAGRVDMVITISRGRSEFDVERFTGRRRSSWMRDNANRAILDADPVSEIPLDEGVPIEGPEFLESSLPIDACVSVQGAYKVNDNRRVTFVNAQGEIETLEAATLAELANTIAVEASGGGFLSNEISYRTHRLREQIGSALPVGHLHVPIPDMAPYPSAGIEPNVPVNVQVSQALIVAQVIDVIKAALLALP